MFNLIYALIVAVFLQGVLQLAFGPIIVKALVEPLIIFIFLLSLTKKRVVMPFTTTFIIFLMSYLTASALNSDLNFASTTFFRPFLYSFFIFYASYKYNPTENEVKKLIKLIKIMVIIQIPASFIKVALVGGVAEKFIGTIGTTTGSLHLIFPLFVISYLIGVYLFHFKDKKVIIYVILFIVFGITGAKKGVPFYTIFLLFVSYYIYNRLIMKRSINLSRLVTISFLSIAIFVLGVWLIPGLNKERKVGGSFDTEYVQKRVYSYSFYNEEKETYAGRFGGTTIFLSDLMGFTDEWLVVKSTKNTLFGYGPSSFDDDSYLVNNKNINPNFQRIIPTGYIRMQFAMGLFGVLGFILFYGNILKMLLRVIKKYFHMYTTLGKALVFGSTLFGFVIFIDFFTYTHMYTYSTIYVVYFLILGQVLKYRKDSLFFISGTHE